MRRMICPNRCKLLFFLFVLSPEQTSNICMDIRENEGNREKKVKVSTTRYPCTKLHITQYKKEIKYCRCSKFQSLIFCRNSLTKFEIRKILYTSSILISISLATSFEWCFFNSNRYFFYYKNQRSNNIF